MDSLLQYASLQDRLSCHISDLEYTDDNNNNDDSNKETFTTSILPAKEDKYSLRPRSLRKLTHRKSDELLEPRKDPTTTKPTSKSHKPKQKAAPLSKYRRKTANARERNRMREINQAFETLRRVIPHMQAPELPGTNEKLTKITTLRLAMKYISTLSAALTGGSPILDTDFSHHHASSDYGDLDCFLLESDGESLSLSDHSGSLLASPDFPEPSLSPVNFGDPSLPALLHTDFTEHTLEPDDFNAFLLT